MSDEMKPISEDGTRAAGDAPRRDSAQAAALTVGSPSSSSEAEKGSADAEPKGLFGKSGKPGSSSSSRAGAAAFGLKTKIGIAAVAVVSAAFIGVSAFAITGGFGLPADSPIIQAAERVGIVSVTQVEANEAASAGHADENGSKEAGKNASESSKESDSSSKDESKAEKESDESSKSSDESNKDESSSSEESASQSSGGPNSNAGASSNSGTNQDNSTSQGGNSGGSSSGSNNNATGGSSSSSNSGGQAPSNVITVSVSVSSSAVGNPVSGGGTFTFAQGATVYDALCACGLSVNAGQTGYGIYVSAIGGLAEKEHGASSGWMYSVNGTVPMTACSNYTLSNGDSVSWYYVTG